MARKPEPRATGPVSSQVGDWHVVACFPPLKGHALVNGADNVNALIYSRLILESTLIQRGAHLRFLHRNKGEGENRSFG